MSGFHFDSESIAELVVQRNAFVASTIRAHGSWAVMYRTKCGDWLEHLSRPRNHYSPAARLCTVLPREELATNRLLRRPNSKPSGTGTRIVAYALPPRWQETVSKSF